MKSHSKERKTKYLEIKWIETKRKNESTFGDNMGLIKKLTKLKLGKSFGLCVRSC